jgi:hypothetical protein
MMRWIVIAIVIVALLVSGAIFTGAFGLGSKNLIMVDRQYSEAAAGLKLAVFHDKIPEDLLFWLTRGEQNQLNQANIPYAVLQRGFQPSDESWFLHLPKELCSPCSANTIKSFAKKIVWTSNHQYLIKSNTKNMRMILNNLGYAEAKARAFNLGPALRSELLPAAPAPTAK